MKAKEITKGFALLSICGVWAFWAMAHVNSLIV